MREWLGDSTGDGRNRRDRLAGVAGLLGLAVDDLDDVGYQLLHRAAVPYLEAKRLNARHAVLLIHSFSQERAHFEDYRAFARLLGGVGETNVVEQVRPHDGIQRHVCWVADTPRVQAHRGEPEFVLLEALDWLRDTYREHRFFKERDVEAALQQRMTELFEERRSEWRVFENHRIPGKRLDLAVVDHRRPAEVALGIELKYEPDHKRAGHDMRGDTARLPVCLAEEIKRDVQEIERSVAEGLIEIGYALLLDEGGYWRSRRTPPRGDRKLWGRDTERRLAPALFVSRVGRSAS